MGSSKRETRFSHVCVRWTNESLENDLAITVSRWQWHAIFITRLSIRCGICGHVECHADTCRTSVWLFLQSDMLVSSEAFVLCSASLLPMGCMWRSRLPATVAVSMWSSC